MNRSGNKWTINEILKLQREYELLNMNVDKIALLHKRSVEAILYKLEFEGFTSNFILSSNAKKCSDKKSNKMKLRSSSKM
jgi:hypothetical protein